MNEYLAILFADIGGSSALYRAVGDQKAHSQIRTCLQGISEDVEYCDGQVLRTVGDAVLASFLSSDNALQAALKISRSQHGGLMVRIGFHCGDVIPDNGDVYGDVVNIAARVADLAQPGEVALTGTARSELTSKMQAKTVLLDHASLKGIEQSIDVYRYRGYDSEEHTSIVDFADRMNEIRRGNSCTLKLCFGTNKVTLCNHNESVTLGRSMENEIRLSADGTSKFHATIECRRGRFVFSDRSTNGSFVVKNQDPYVFVHRDSITLDGKGKLYLGQAPDKANSGGIVEYEFMLKHE